MPGAESAASCSRFAGTAGIDAVPPPWRTPVAIAHAHRDRATASFRSQIDLFVVGLGGVFARIVHEIKSTCSTANGSTSTWRFAAESPQAWAGSCRLARRAGEPAAHAVDPP